MVPLEEKNGRWHTKWCSACGAKLYDIFIGGDPASDSATLKLSTI